MGIFIIAIVLLIIAIALDFILSTPGVTTILFILIFIVIFPIKLGLLPHTLPVKYVTEQIILGDNVETERAVNKYNNSIQIVIDVKKAKQDNWWDGIIYKNFLPDNLEDELLVYDNGRVYYKKNQKIILEEKISSSEGENNGEK